MVSNDNTLKVYECKVVLIEGGEIRTFVILSLTEPYARIAVMEILGGHHTRIESMVVQEIKGPFGQDSVLYDNFNPSIKIPIGS